jgi:carbon storage regulator
MLVITRRKGERFFIGEDIEIAILDVQGGKVRIGVEAPPELLVLREELGRPGEVEDLRESRDTRGGRKGGGR